MFGPIYFSKLFPTIDKQMNMPARTCHLGGTPLMGYMGMCGPKGYGFSAILVINRISILAILGINRISILAILGINRV